LFLIDSKDKIGRREKKTRGEKKGMEIKANFIALKSGSGIHQFLGKISNQGEVQIASYKNEST
jgi:hypothetical protein